MTYDNVQLWFARDTNNKIVTINEVDKKNKDGYTCPLCNSEVIPRQGEKNSWCFAHIDKSKCNTESLMHWWYKNKFLIQGDKFIVKADENKEYTVKSIEIEKEYKVGNKTYRPDVTVLTTTGETIFFEMDYSNKKKIEDYIDIWIELNSIVVEIDLKTLINSSLDNKREFKALYYMGKCFNIKSKDKKYYDIIGKYKEQLIQNKEYDKRKDDIKKLDWFWKELIKYKQKIVDIEHMICLIDYMENSKDKQIINEILNKPICNNLYKDYKKEKKRIFEEKQKKHDLNLENGRKNIYLQNSIDKINKKLKNIDDNYSFYNRFGYDLFITLDYNYITKVDIDIRQRDDLIYSNNEKYIYNILYNYISLYINKITAFKNHNILLKLCENLDKYYNNIKLIKIKKGIKYIHNYGVEYRLIAQNCIRLNLYIQDENEYKRTLYINKKQHTYLYILNDGIFSNKDWKWADKMETIDYKKISNIISIIDTNNNLDEVMKILKNEISNRIRRNRYYDE